MVDHLLNRVLFYFSDALVILCFIFQGVGLSLSFIDSLEGTWWKMKMSIQFYADSQWRAAWVTPCLQSMSFITVIVKQGNQVSLGKNRLMPIMACHWSQNVTVFSSAYLKIVKSEEDCLKDSFIQEIYTGSRSVPGIALGAGETIVNITKGLSSWAHILGWET